MNVRLIVEQGKKRTVIPLRPPQAILGRAKGNTVRIPSAEVSRRHCRLILQDGLVTVEDLDSINGTFLNGRRIKEAEVVRPGDGLDVGPVHFVLDYQLSPQAQARLRDQEDPVEMLEALADGEVVDVDQVEVSEPFEFDPEPLEELESLESLEEVQPLEDDLESLEEVEPIEPTSARPTKLPPKPPPKAKPEPARPPADDGMIKADFDFDATPWEAPSGDDLRDILSQLEDDDTEPAPPPKKKKKA
jgi:pilus assembly protein CpaF